MSMDTYLAEKYGSIANDPEMEKQASLEKRALAEVLVKVAAENDVDLSDFDFNEVDEDEMLEALEQMLPDDEGEEGEEGPEFQEKVAEAEYLGRVMAHTFTAERNEIEKLAADKKPTNPISRALTSTGMGTATGGISGALTGAGLGYGMGGMPGVRGAILGGLGGAALGGAGGNLSSRAGRAIYARAARGRANMGGKGVNTSDAKNIEDLKKASSAFETIAEQRALEIAEHWGITKTAGDEEFENELNYRALEMLAENGVDVDSFLAE